MYRPQLPRVATSEIPRPALRKSRIDGSATPARASPCSGRSRVLALARTASIASSLAARREFLSSCACGPRPAPDESDVRVPLNVLPTPITRCRRPRKYRTRSARAGRWRPTVMHQTLYHCRSSRSTSKATSVSRHLLRTQVIGRRHLTPSAVPGVLTPAGAVSGHLPGLRFQFDHPEDWRQYPRTPVSDVPFTYWISFLTRSTPRCGARHDRLAAR